MGQAATDMPTILRGIANRARKEPKARFQNLYGMLNEATLRWCFHQLRKDAATGVDGVTFDEYGRNLDANLAQLVERLKGKRYRAKWVRRVQIPKGQGKWRPLGIPALEDKLVQMGAAKLLEAIYEQDFLNTSWGFRAGRGPQKASRVLAGRLVIGKYHWVVEADIRAFFDSISHDWMERMLQERVDDRAFIRLIGKWLKAGVMQENGQVEYPEIGTPQGGVISPVLANIYLHYVLDLWFERVVRKTSQGQAMVMRFADDFVAAFEQETEARCFLAKLGARLAKFGLTLAEEKTRVVQFSRNAIEQNGGFDFLGFQYHWNQTRRAVPNVQRMTAPARLRRSIARFTEWIKRYRHLPIRVLMTRLNPKLQGYWNYYGVTGNFRSLQKYWHELVLLLYKWLNRRSDRRSYNWEGFLALLEHFRVPRPHITEVASRQLSLTGFSCT